MTHHSEGIIFRSPTNDASASRVQTSKPAAPQVPIAQLLKNSPETGEGVTAASASLDQKTACLCLFGKRLQAKVKLKPWHSKSRNFTSASQKNLQRKCLCSSTAKWTGLHVQGATEWSPFIGHNNSAFPCLQFQPGVININTTWSSRSTPTDRRNAWR